MRTRIDTRDLGLSIKAEELSALMRGDAAAFAAFKAKLVDVFALLPAGDPRIPPMAKLINELAAK